jgi:DNA N-6-adenine-methyltransferase Dam
MAGTNGPCLCRVPPCRIARMKRPTGWRPNPQALASVSLARSYTGDPRLSSRILGDGDTWLTPKWLLGQLGEFDLDPCACPQIPNWVCSRNFTAEDNGLVLPWEGRVFMNPPFSNTVPWLAKHAEHGNGTSLVPASIESRVWRSHVWPRAKAILLLHGRTRFCNPDGSTTTGRPLRSIALIAWSDVDAAILHGSAIAGVFLTAWKQR